MMGQRSHPSITDQITPRRTSRSARAYSRITPVGLLAMLFGLGLSAPATTRALDLTAGTEAELADAIAQVNGAGAGTHTITLIANIALTASTPAINNATAGVEIVIDGAGFTVDGQNGSGVWPFTIIAGIVEIRDTIIARGVRFFGGGGGVHNGGTLTMTNCTVSGNNGGLRGGGGGIYNTAMLTMTNCTVSGNDAGNSGGGIYNDTGATLTMANCTVSGNTSDFGGGIFNETGTLTMTATIVAGNTAGLSGRDVAGSAVTSGGYNLIGDGTGSPGFTGPGDQVGTAVAPIDPLLGPLADNGGATQTHALLPGSPALNAIRTEDCAVATDQRGITRPSGRGCDIGAFEAQFDLLGDADGDGDVDLADLLEIVACLSTAGNAIGDGCAIFDFDQDRDVNLGDLIAFQAAFTGAQGL